jgi:hypothetical protein
LRRGVIVEGEDESGADVKAEAGDTADSASTLELSPKLPVSQGLAQAMANGYHAYLSTLGRQRTERIAEPDERIRVLDQVVRDGVTYRAIVVETDAENEEQELELVEEGV